MNKFIEKKIIIKIKRIIFKYIEDGNHNFFLFWSRVDGKMSKKADYDIWVIWKIKLDSIIKMKIEEWFENIPALIDFVDFNEVSEDFKKEAMKKIIWLNK